jgi:hypothetical protein
MEIVGIEGDTPVGEIFATSGSPPSLAPPNPKSIPEQLYYFILSPSPTTPTTQHGTHFLFDPTALQARTR